MQHSIENTDPCQTTAPASGTTREYTEITQISFIRDTLASAIEGIKNLSGGKKTVMSESLIEEAKENGDFMNFFLFTEGMDQIHNDNSTTKAMESMEKLIARYKTDQSSKMEILRKMAEENKSIYLRFSSTLTRLMNLNVGNCEAFAKLMIVLVKSVFPKIEIQIQIFKDHIRAIVKNEGKLYAMESKFKELKETDFDGTAIMSPEVFMEYRKNPIPERRNVISKLLSTDSIYEFNAEGLRPHSKDDQNMI